MTKRDTSTTKHASDRSKKGSTRLHDKITGSSDASSKKHPQLKTSQKDLAARNLSIHTSNGTFFSDSPDEPTPVEAIKGSRFDHGQEEHGSVGHKTSTSGLSKPPQPMECPIADIAPWMDDGLPQLSTHGLASLANFNTDASSHHISSSIRPDIGDSVPRDLLFDNDERRPSLATTESSQTSVSNSVSKASTNRGTPYKKVGGFFSDEYGRQSSRSSDTSIPATLQREQTSSSKHGSIRHGHHGSRDDMGLPTSPTGSRPRTPLPSSDVTPWLFQDFKEIQQFGDAPVRQSPAGLDKQRYGDGDPLPRNNHHSHHPHRLHLPHHRHTRSKEDPPTPPPKDPANGLPLRPLAQRTDSASSVRMLKDAISSPMSSRNTLPIRGTSPTPSSNSGVSRSETMPGQWSPAVSTSSGGKRSLLSKLRGKKGDHESQGIHGHHSGSTASLQHASTRDSKKSDVYAPKDASRQGSVATFDSGSTAKASDYSVGDAASPITKKESGTSRILHSHGKIPKPKRAFSYDKEAEKQRNATLANESVWALDTNLDDMTGIVDPHAVALVGLPHGGIFTGEPIQEEPRKDTIKDAEGAWDAPESWAVKKVGDENMSRLREIDDAGIPQQMEHDGTPHCVRIFRIDSTFATLSMPVNTTSAEILQVLGKKSFLQDDLDNYQIILNKHELHRQLAPGERPIAIQKKLFEQAGYEASDRIEEIGREDNSYLCRFSFVPTKLSGYYSLEKEPGLGKMLKFSHVDLQGRSIVTIPITLYQKAADIISLNLSRNLALDVPKDFIQSCINLREIRYISCEAWKLPASFSLATKLTVLDISNNRLEQLEHAELDKLPNLVSIKLSNNKLKHLPSYFGRFSSLRSLNLSSNYIEAFPDFLCDLKGLVDLDLSFNTVKVLPKIGQLTSLERIWATNNMLYGSFADSFKELRNLKEIDLRFNAITDIDVFAKLPKLEQLMVGHNVISKFEGSFEKIRLLNLDHNPMTRFDFKAPVPTLTTLNLASCKISQLDDSCFERMENVSKLTLDKNHFSTLSTQVSKLQKLEYLSIARNPLSSLPATIGHLHELRFLDVRECNLKRLPPEIWFCHRLDSLNVSSNVLETFPKPATGLPASQPDTQTHDSDESTPVPAGTPEDEDPGRLEDFQARRPSQASAGLLSVGSSPASSTRQGSIVSVYGQGGRKASVISKTQSNGGNMSPTTRKDSNFQQQRTNTFAGTLRNLYLADNRLTDDVFDDIATLPELRVLNLSYNELYDVPTRSLRRWQYLAELYLSGNELSCLPSDDLEEASALKVLHINGNKFQVLPAELGKVRKLTVLDVGSNSLKYNVSNWPYDWNWNWNKNLKYLNFSGNKRLEIKPSRAFAGSNNRESADLTNFTTLHHLRILGLMDVTLTIPSVPDQTEDRRVRTSGSLAGSMAYGMADSLGKHEHLSTIDMVVPKFRGHEAETLLGIFDGQAMSSGGSRLAKYLHENFQCHFTEELSRLKKEETPCDGFRRTFLALNKDLATTANQTLDEKEHRAPQKTHRGSITAQTLSADDLNSGGVATVIYMDNMELYVANVGDAQAMLMQSDGGHKILTRKHEPADRQERERIREAGGFVSRHGRLNDVLEVSRAFGYIQMMPAVMAAPNITHVTLKESDEMVLIASKELWDYMSLDMVVDVARSERGDLMRAAQKLRDLAMAFGATGKLMVQIIGVSDLKKRERNRYRGQSLSMGPSQMPDDQTFPAKRGKRRDNRPDDSTLQRLDPEVEAPTGELSMVFTDIKNSTTLWENYPVAMRSAIKSHNELMRRQLRVIGGYEVKTEGDAFVVSFPTATAALLWCFVVQQQLLDVDWPPEILNTEHCQEVLDQDDNRIYRGLSVRMGIHWGSPVCEPDPVTRRMDYFGPMVNRAARISGAADGGQIYVSSEYVAEIVRSYETHADGERSGSTGSEDSLTEEPMAASIRKELRALSTQGFEVKDLGRKMLKGLENPEVLFLMYPHTLAGRLNIQQERTGAETAGASNEPTSKQPDSALEFDTEWLWSLWNVSLRLEMLCSALECPGCTSVKMPEKSVLERMKNRGGEVTDRFLVGFLEHQVIRIEACIAMLDIRNEMTPFNATNLLEQACPMNDVLGRFRAERSEHKTERAELEATRTELEAKSAQLETTTTELEALKAEFMAYRERYGRA